MSNIKDVIRTNGLIQSWVENDETFVVTRNTNNTPAKIQSKRGKWLEEAGSFNYAADGTFAGMQSDIASEMLPALLGEALRLEATKGIAVSGNRTLTASDLEQVLDVSAAATLTIPTDAVLGIAPDDRITVGAYQKTTGAVTWAGSGVTLRGTAPTAAQYLVTGLVHVGLNEWSYL